METENTVQIPDSDIDEEIRKFIRSYDPLKQSRGHFSWEVTDGHVTLKGNIHSILAHRVLVDSVPDIEGVISVDASELYEDEAVKRNVAKILPPGILVRVNYGAIVLAGFLPEGSKEEDLVKKVQVVPGVMADKVRTEFISAAA